jgi:hypothetical protein
VRLVGVADPTLARRSVRFRGTGRTVARATVRSDGRFSAAAPLPPRTRRATARYRATIGHHRSNALELRRRITIRPLTFGHGGVRIRGRVSKPLAKPRRITLTRRVACRYRVVRRFKPRADGTFVVNVRARKGAAFRVSTRVRRSVHSRKTIRARSLPLYYRGA